MHTLLASNDWMHSADPSPHVGSGGELLRKFSIYACVCRGNEENAFDGTRFFVVRVIVQNTATINFPI